MRLCSIECNFREPLDNPDIAANAAFAADIRGWAKQADRLYIWDYVTDFAHFIQPFPNWFTSVRTFVFFKPIMSACVFEEGATRHLRRGNGGNARVGLAPIVMESAPGRQGLDPGIFGRLLWRRMSAPLARYLELMQKASLGYNQEMFHANRRAFLWASSLWRSRIALAGSRTRVANDPELLARVRQGHRAVQCVWLTRCRCPARGGLARRSKLALHRDSKRIRQAMAGRRARSSLIRSRGQK